MSRFGSKSEPANCVLSKQSPILPVGLFHFFDELAFLPTPIAMEIRPYQTQDELAVVALWDVCGLTRPWNDPHRDIARKLTEQPELFLVGTETGRIIATAMVGFDGHRGWVYYLAVAPDFQRLSYGKALMLEAERLLIARGCPKVNLLVRSSNKQVIEFYLSLGYSQDDTVSLGRRLISDLPPQEG